MIAPWRVVDDELDAGGGLERADVAAFAADDSSLEVIARQVDDRHRRFDGVLGGAPLDRVRNDLLRADGGGFARFRLETLDEVGCVTPRVGFDLLQQQLACLVGGQAGDPLQLAVPFGNQLIGACPSRSGGGFMLGDCLCFRAQILLDAIAGGEPIGQRASLVREGLFEAQDFVAPLADLPVRLGGSFVRFFASFERHFLAEGLGIPFGLPDQAVGLGSGAVDCFGGSNSAAAGQPPEHYADGCNEGKEDGEKRND